MHPANRKERNYEARKKGLKRSEALFCTGRPISNEERRKQIQKGALRLRDTTKLCSCPSCGNPRNHFGTKTRQEYKSDCDFQQQLNEEVKDKEEND